MSDSTGKTAEIVRSDGSTTVKFERGASASRWLILTLACIVMLGSYYCYDNPSALKKQLCAYFDPTLSDFQFNMMYSVYSFPNILLPLLGGFFVDRLGTSITLVVFASLILAGQAVFALGVSLKNYGLVLFGRVLFGFGGESLGVAQSTLLATWFRGKEVAFSMGLALSISRLGSVVNDYVSPAIYNAASVPTALWFGFLICVASVVSAISIMLVERWATKQVQESEAVIEAEKKRYYDALPEADKQRLEAEQRVASEKSELRKKRKMEEQQQQQQQQQQGGDLNQKLLDQPANANDDEQVRLSDIKEFGSLFWLLCIGCFVVYGTILPFNNIAGDFLQDRFDYSTDTADQIMSIPFFISAALCPFLGGVVDKFGMRAWLQTVSAFAIFLVHFYFFATHWTPYPPLVLQGLAYSIFAAAIWPSVPRVVKKHQVGTAYGLVNSVQNFGLAFIPLLNGAIKDDSGSYHYVELFFFCLALVGVAIGICLIIVDNKYNNGVLNRSRSEDDAEKDREAAEAKATAEREDAADASYAALAGGDSSAAPRNGDVVVAVNNPHQHNGINNSDAHN